MIKTTFYLLVASFFAFTSCNDKQQDANSKQQDTARKGTRESAVLLKENGELRVKPLQGMDLVKEAPQPPVDQVVVQEGGADNLSMATTSKSLQSGHAELKQGATSQSPMIRATIRTQAMEEMARRKNQAAENQK